MGRLNHFNPSLQGPNEPSGSSSGRITQYEEEIDELEQELSIAEDKASNLWLLIKRDISNLRKIRKDISSLKSSIADYEDWKKDEEENYDQLITRQQEIKLEIEMLSEDPGNEEKIQSLKKELDKIKFKL